MKKIAFFIIAFLISVSMSGQNYTELKPSQLPKKITEFVAKNLKGGVIKRAAKTNEKDTRYAIVATSSNGKKSILVFDKNGDFLQRAKNKEELSQIIAGKSVAKSSVKPNQTDPPVKK